MYNLLFPIIILNALQFQCGTPHVHSLVWIANDGITEESVNSEDEAEQENVKKLIKKTVSAILVVKRNAR